MKNLTKHETEILEFKVKVSQNERKINEISTDCIKREELGQLMNESLTATSYALPDVSTSTERRLSIKTILTGQAKYNAAFQMANRTSMTFSGEVVRNILINCTYFSISPLNVIDGRLAI